MFTNDYHAIHLYTIQSAADPNLNRQGQGQQWGNWQEQPEKKRKWLEKTILSLDIQENHFCRIKGHIIK